MTSPLFFILGDTSSNYQFFWTILGYFRIFKILLMELSHWYINTLWHHFFVIEAKRDKTHFWIGKKKNRTMRKLRLRRSSALPKVTKPSGRADLNPGYLASKYSKLPKKVFQALIYIFSLESINNMSVNIINSNLYKILLCANCLRNII